MLWEPKFQRKPKFLRNPNFNGTQISTEAKFLWEPKFLPETKFLRNPNFYGTEIFTEPKFLWELKFLQEPKLQWEHKFQWESRLTNSLIRLTDLLQLSCPNKSDIVRTCIHVLYVAIHTVHNKLLS